MTTTGSSDAQRTTQEIVTRVEIMAETIDFQRSLISKLEKENRDRMTWTGASIFTAVSFMSAAATGFVLGIQPNLWAWSIGCLIASFIHASIDRWRKKKGGVK